MKPWQINILIIIGVLAIIFFLPGKVVRFLSVLIVFGSAIWVYLDAKKLNISKYKKTILSPSDSPLGAAFIVWILWLIAFPMYISYRYRIINGKIPLKEERSEI